MDLENFMEQGSENMKNPTIQKYLKAIEDMAEPTFNALYFTYLSLESLEKIKEDLIRCEEYEKVILVNEMIKMNYTGKEVFEEYDAELMRNVQEMTDEMVQLISSGMEPDDPSIKDIAKKLHVLNNEMFVDNINRRISKIKSRDINPFEKDKYYNMFEYYKSEAIKYNEDLKTNFMDASKEVQKLSNI
jgi:phage terminase small subunit